MSDSTPEFPCPIGSCEGYVKVIEIGGGRGFGCTGTAQHQHISIRGAMDAENARYDTIEAFELSETERRIDHVAWVKDRLDEATTEPDEYIGDVDLDAVRSLPPFPHGFSGEVLGLNSFKGMVTLNGKASAGKSWVALGSGLRSAAEGWDVHYIACEGDDVIVRRLQASSAKHEGFRIHFIEPGVTAKHLIDKITSWIISARTLLIIDSISTLQALMGGRGAEKWDAASELEMFLMRIRSLTQGWVSIINLSEQNSAGETKGRSLDHRSDMSISFESCKEESKVKIVELRKSWESETGILGFGRVDWRLPGITLSDIGPGESAFGGEVPSNIDEPKGFPQVSLATISSLPELEQPDDWFNDKEGI